MKTHLAKTKTLLAAPAALTLAVVMTGCAGGAYKQGNWAHSGYEADWDIDSAICLRHSETLTADDLEAIEEMKEQNQEVTDSVNEVAEASSAYGDSTYANYAAGLFGAFVGARNSNAEEIYKEQKFTACLQEKGWSK